MGGLGSGNKNIGTGNSPASIATRFKPGNPGKPSGALGKRSVEVQTAIALTFQGIGGVPALIKWAKKHPRDFYCKIWTRILPLNIDVNQTTTIHYRTVAEVEEAIANRSIPMKRLEPLLLELEAEQQDNGSDDQNGGNSAL